MSYTPVFPNLDEPVSSIADALSKDITSNGDAGRGNHAYDNAKQVLVELATKNPVKSLAVMAYLVNYLDNTYYCRRLLRFLGHDV